MVNELKTRLLFSNFSQFLAVYIIELLKKKYLYNNHGNLYNNFNYDHKLLLFTFYNFYFRLALRLEVRDSYVNVKELLNIGVTPFPYKVAKSLDADIYRNVEYDTWNDIRRGE